MLIITHNIRKREFKSNQIPGEKLKTIINSIEKGIFTYIKGQKLPKRANLIKIYATTNAGAIRLLFLLDRLSLDVFLLFFRNKNDKIGNNMTIKNPHFQKVLNLHLDIISEDLNNGNFDTYPISTKNFPI